MLWVQVSGQWSCAGVAAALVEQGFEPCGDVGMLAKDVSGLGRIGRQVVELRGGRVGLDAAVLDVAVDGSGKRKSGRSPKRMFAYAGPREASASLRADVDPAPLADRKVLLRVGGEDHVLNQGDSIYFDPSPAHSYRRVGTKACTAVVVTTA